MKDSAPTYVGCSPLFKQRTTCKGDLLVTEHFLKEYISVSQYCQVSTVALITLLKLLDLQKQLVGYALFIPISKAHQLTA